MLKQPLFYFFKISPYRVSYVSVGVVIRGGVLEDTF